MGNYNSLIYYSFSGGLMYVFYLIWLFPLTGVLGGMMFLSNIQSFVERFKIRNPLESKGIFDPAQKFKLVLNYIFIDFLWKLNICYWSDYYWSYDDVLELDFIAVFYGMAFIIISTFLLCKYLLPNINIRSTRKTSNKTNYTLLGVIMSIVFFIDVVMSLIIQYGTCWYADETESMIFSVLCICVGSCISLRPYIFFRRYDRIKGEAERTISSLVTHRAPIIFLRSFEIDKFVVRGYSFDEYICRSFSMTSQPILSLSDPDDFLPTGGSIKIQSFDEKWKEAIILLLKNCRAVVIFEGKSEGLQWEIENLKKYISYDQLFVATPPKKYRQSAWCRGKTNKEKKYALNFIWTNFAKHLIKEGFHVPLSDPGNDVVFSFNKNWESKDEGIVCQGMRFFDYILENTVKYEKVDCDYKELAEALSSYELSLRLQEEVKRKVNRAILIIMSIFIIIMLSITLFV